MTAPPSARFRTTLMSGGGNATGLVIPDGVVETLGQGKRLPVRVTINGYTYRNTVAVYGGQYMIGVAAEHRAKAGIAAGDVIEVELALDTEPRVVVMPPDLAEALAPHAGARERFEKLSYTNQKEMVRSIEDAKADATRLRRIEKAVETLRADEGEGARRR